MFINFYKYLTNTTNVESKFENELEKEKRKNNRMITL